MLFSSQHGRIMSILRNMYYSLDWKTKIFTTKVQSLNSCKLYVKGNKVPHFQMPLKTSLQFLCISDRRHFESQIQCLFFKQNQCRSNDSLSTFPYILDLKIKMLTGIATVNFVPKIHPYLFLYTSKAFIRFSSFIRASAFVY